MTTTTDLLARLDRIDGVRRALLADVEALPAPLRRAHPVPGKWSVLEILEHLVLAEEAVLRQFRAPAGAGGHSLRDRVMYRVVMFVLRFDIPVRVPARAMVPGGGAELAELRERWDTNFQALREAVAAMGEEAPRRPVARHPVAGPMTAGQALAMLDVHVRRHGRQVRSRIRLLAQETPPPEGHDERP
jgi:uncharacterized damage-inducible protein DinB